MKARDTLVYLAVKYSGDWHKIYNGVLKKEDVDYEECEKVISSLKCNYITLLDEEYPNYLKQTIKPPFVLFYYGDISLLKDNTNSIVVCGSRDINLQNRKALTDYLTTNKADKIIVSTLTTGTGELAIETGLKNGNKVIGVMASGIDNCRTYEKVKEQGLIISEFPNDTPLEQVNIMARNRYLAMLGSEVLVSQITKQSGNNTIVMYGINYGKDIVVIPQPFESEYSNNELIYEGAIPALLGVN